LNRKQKEKFLEKRKERKNKKRRINKAKLVNKAKIKDSNQEDRPRSKLENICKSKIDLTIY